MTWTPKIASTILTYIVYDNISDPEPVRKLAGWGLTQNDRASFAGWNPQPSAYCSEIRLPE